MLLPLLMVFACVPTICLFSTQQVGMSLFEKTDLGLDVRLEEKSERTINLHLKAQVCPFLEHYRS